MKSESKFNPTVKGIVEKSRKVKKAIFNNTVRKNIVVCKVIKIW